MRTKITHLFIYQFNQDDLSIPEIHLRGEGIHLKPDISLGSSHLFKDEFKHSIAKPFANK